MTLGAGWSHCLCPLHIVTSCHCQRGRGLKEMPKCLKRGGWNLSSYSSFGDGNPGRTNCAGPYRALSRSCQRPTFMKDITYVQYGRTRRNAPVAVFCCTRAELGDGVVAVAAPINKISCCIHLPTVWRQIDGQPRKARRMSIFFDLVWA
jgi:hypothetical protein